MIRYGQYGKKASWIVKKNVKCVRKVSWNVKRYGNYEKKISWRVKRFGKYRRKLWNDMENMNEMWNDREIWKKSKLKSEKIWNIWKKGKFISEMIWKLWKISELVIITPKETSSLVWYPWLLGFFCLISGSGNGWIHVFNGGRHSVQIFPSQQRKWCTTLNESVS